MAEVLCPLVPSNAPTLSPQIQVRPSSSSAIDTMSGSQSYSSQPRPSSRSHYNSANGYRGTAAAPTYAFKATPQLKVDHRNTTKPLTADGGSAGNRQRYPATNESISTTSSTSSSTASWSQSLFAKDDSVLNSNFTVAPFTTPAAAAVDASSVISDHSTKSVPNRYHRQGRKSDTNLNPLRASEEQEVAYLKEVDEQAILDEPATNDQDFPSLPPPGSQSFKRYKRRSSSGISAATDSTATQVTAQQPATAQPKALAHGPARTFADVAKRTNVPSPLSRPPVQGNGPPSPEAPRTNTNTAFQNSPAVAAMAALSEKDSQRGVKSKFRRAFSFGSTVEMKRVGEDDAAIERARLRKEQFSSELDEEQEAIAKQQTAAGLGNNIYSGQAGFASSTDNISISSTASSASLMLRKMGRGMKKGGRSIKGLFRPKSVIGVPPADGPAVGGQISFVTVEAEREKVNVNAHPHEQTAGGTGFPRLERNSMDAARLSNGDSDRPDTRKSILGGESDRQEVLAAVRRGILKRTPSDLPAIETNNLANHVIPSFERRGSPVPSNASNEGRQRSGHRRTDSVALEGSDDYFASMPPKQPNMSSRSLPTTPRGSSRNISFSPRIQFYDVWSASDYDRRGDIATCNRLTPMLAQQIKEELNTFKMEMEVHEMSKPHTHFF